MRKLLVGFFAIVTLLTSTFSNAEIKITADQTIFSESDCKTVYKGNVKLRTNDIREISSKHSNRLDENNIQFTGDVKIKLDSAVIKTEEATYATIDDNVLVTMKSATVSSTYSCEKK